MKKIIALLLVVGTISIGLSSCADKQDGVTTPTETVTPSETPIGDSSTSNATPSANPNESKKPQNSTEPTKKPTITNAPNASQKPTAPPKTETPAQKPTASADQVAKKVLATFNGDAQAVLSAMPADLWSSSYQLDKSKYDDVAIYGSSIGLNVEEIIIIKAKDQGSLSQAKSYLEGRKTTLIKQWENYLPEQYEVVKKSKIVSNGLYAALIVGNDADKGASAFNSATK